MDDKVTHCGLLNGILVLARVKETQGWGDGSVNIMLAAQVWRPESAPSTQAEARYGVHTRNLRVGRVPGNCWPINPADSESSRASEKLSLKK